MALCVVEYRDRQGKEIGLLEWAELQEDRAYRFLADEALANGRRVVTIWNGVISPSVIRPFSTGVFAPSETEHLGKMLHEEMYDAETDALAGHARLVAEWSSR